MFAAVRLRECAVPFLGNVVWVLVWVNKNIIGNHANGPRLKLISCLDLNLFDPYEILNMAANVFHHVPYKLFST